MFEKDFVDFFIFGFYIFVDGEDLFEFLLFGDEFLVVFVFVDIVVLFLILLFFIVFWLLYIFNIVVLLGWGVDSGCFFFFLGIS